MLITATNPKRVMTKIEDTRSLMSYAHYLLMKAQLTGNLCIDGHFPSQEELRIEEQCRRLCERICHTLDFCKFSDIPELLDYYDFAYRIGYKCLPDSSIIKRHKRRVFEAWKDGDKEISESAVYATLLSEVRFAPDKADRNYTDALNSIKGEWVETLKKYGRFPEVTTYENYRRLAYMMRENLDRELGGNAEKEKLKWYELNRIDDLSSIGSLILISYRRYVSSLYPMVLDDEAQVTLDNQILAELSTRPDLTPYDREAFRLALQFNKLMVVS